MRRTRKPPCHLHRPILSSRPTGGPLSPPFTQSPFILIARTHSSPSQQDWDIRLSRRQSQCCCNTSKIVQCGGICVGLMFLLFLCQGPYLLARQSVASAWHWQHILSGYGFIKWQWAYSTSYIAPPRPTQAISFHALPHLYTIIVKLALRGLALPCPALPISGPGLSCAGMDIEAPPCPNHSLSVFFAEKAKKKPFRPRIQILTEALPCPHPSHLSEAPFIIMGWCLTRQSDPDLRLQG